MRKVHISSMVLLCLLGLTASPVFGAYAVTYVGDNPWANSGFPSTGGSGSIEGQTVEKTFTSLGDIPIIVDGGPSTGTDMLHIDERVRNDTGVAWTDFHFVVEPIDANLGLDVSFLNIDNPTGEWTGIEASPNALSLLGNVPNGGIFSLSFDLAISSEVGAYNLFGIHEYPTVPEPSTLVLLGCSLLGLIRPRGLRLSA